MGFCCANHQFFRGVQRFGLHLRVVMATDAHQAPEHGASDGQPACDQQENSEYRAHQCLLCPYGLKHTPSSGQSSLCSVAVY